MALLGACIIALGRPTPFMCSAQSIVLDYAIDLKHFPATRYTKTAVACAFFFSYRALRVNDECVKYTLSMKAS